MLRSIDYAIATASRTAAADRKTSLRDWGRDAERAFVGGYLGAVRIADGRLIPAGSGAFRQALDLFMIEKALYEVRYELDNRPDWIEIPLGAIKRIAGLA